MAANIEERLARACKELGIVQWEPSKPPVRVAKVVDGETCMVRFGVSERGGRRRPTS